VKISSLSSPVFEFRTYKNVIGTKEIIHVGSCCGSIAKNSWPGRGLKKLFEARGKLRLKLLDYLKRLRGVEVSTAHAKPSGKKW